MKSVLISIQPKWCELIASGRKTIEVRKTRPKMETPFKCYIYCTSVKKLNLEEYCRVHISTGGTIDDWCDKVIGEFVCDYITTIFYDSDIRYGEDFPERVIQGIIDSNVSCTELKEYSNGKDIYGWHISNLKIYDEPLELSEFTITRKCTSCKDSGYESSACAFDDDCTVPLTLYRPPRSWCYVEELHE